MKAGDLDQRVTIQKIKDSATVGNTGHIDKTDDDNWENHLTRWAAVEEKDSREFVRAKQFDEQIVEMITLRADTQSRTITSEMRIIWRGRLLNIGKPPIEDVGREWITIHCVEPR